MFVCFLVYGVFIVGKSKKNKNVSTSFNEYLVDIPTLQTLETPDSGWTNVGSFASKSEAIQWIRENIGYCDDEGNINLITFCPDNID